MSKSITRSMPKAPVFPFTNGRKAIRYNRVDEDSMIVVLEGNFLFQIEGTVQSTLIEPSDCFTLQKNTKIKADFSEPLALYGAENRGLV